MGLRVVDLIGPVCADPDDGLRLLREIEGLWPTGSEVVADFSGVTTLTSAFLNVAIGRLYGEHAAADVDRRVICVGLDEADASVVALVRANAKRFYVLEPSQRRRALEASESSLFKDRRDTE